MSAHREIEVTLVWPIYDEDARAAEIERLQLEAWGAAHACCYGDCCRSSHPTSRCHSVHKPWQPAGGGTER